MSQNFNGPVTVDGNEVAPAYCYRGMFKGCTNLTTFPAIYAKTYYNYSCGTMFKDCTQLTYKGSSVTGYTVAFSCPISGTGVSSTNTSFSNMLGKGSTEISFSLNRTIYLKNNLSIIYD